jgi:GT2 family glycosyltransferase
MAENGCWGVQVPEVLFTAHYEDDSISTQGPESRVLNTNILMAKHRISSDPISIIIPTYANANVLNRCLRTIKMNTVGEYEVILIDDSPYPDGRFSNEVKDIAARYGKVFFYRPGSRLHHTGCINFAMNYAQYENLCFLNDDTMVSHFWNTKLITAFNRLPKASCIGPMTSKSASVQEIHVLAKTRHIMNESNINLIQCFLEKEYKPKSICAKITGFCFVTNKDMLDKIGEFDEGIKAGGNEADWIIRGLKYELYPYVRTDTYVHHYGGLSYIGNERKKQWDNGLDTIKKKHGEKLVDFLENDLYLKLLKG